MLVNNLKEDKRIFGEHNSSMYSSYVVETLFNNTGGYSANVYQVRLVGSGSLPAKTMVKNASANTQAIVSSTVQNASATQGQKDEITISNVEVGDKFTLSIPEVGYNHTHTSISTDANDVLQALKSNLLGASLPTGYVVDVISGKLTIVSPVDTTFTSTTSSVNDSTSENIFEIIAGRENEQDPGNWGNNLRVRVYPINHPNGSPDGYKLEVFYKGYLVETFISNADDWQSLVDAVNQRSGYILINPTDLGVALELSVFDSALSGGVYVAPTNSDYEPRYHSVTGEPLGMTIFEGVDVQILACPEMFSVNYAKLCDDFARKVDKFFLFSLPYLATESVIQSYYNGLFTPDQSFCASILNWAEVPADQDGNKIWVPAIGYALGSGYIRKAGLYNGYVWTPPAGIETNSKGIYRFTHDNLSEDTLGRYVKKWRTNVVKYIKNVGFCLWSSRTYSNNTLFESIHVRLETNWIIANVKVRNEKFIQRINTPSLQKDMKVDNLIWFKNLYEKGGIERSIPFDDAVIIDIETSKENRKEVEMEIAWIPPECIEHLHIKVSRNDGILILNF